MSNEKARQPRGIPTGGQFAPETHTEPAVSLDAPAGPATAADVIRAGTQPVLLRFVNYDERLTTEQIDMVLAGRWAEAEDDADEARSDSAYEEALRVAEEEVNEAFEDGRLDRGWDELGDDERDEARWAVEERDSTDALGDLLRNTPDQLMRTSLGRPEERLRSRGSSWGSRLERGGDRDRYDAVAALLQDSGLDTSAPEVREAIEELVDNGPYDWHEGVQLDVIFYGPIEDATPSARSAEEGGSGSGRELEFNGPRVLLIDKWNGSGHDVKIPGTLRRTLAAPAEDGQEAPQTARVYLDESAGGWSWDETAGVHKPAYRDGAPTSRWLQDA